MLKKFGTIVATLCVGAVLTATQSTALPSTGQDPSARQQNAPAAQQNPADQQTNPPATQQQTTPSTQQQNPESAPSAQQNPSETQQPSTTADQNPAGSSGKNDQMPKIRTWKGEISQSNGQYILKHGSRVFQLDDQDKAKQFDGQSVKVSGSLDKPTKTIHVSDIQAATGSKPTS